MSNTYGVQHDTRMRFSGLQLLLLGVSLAKTEDYDSEMVSFGVCQANTTFPAHGPNELGNLN